MSAVVRISENGFFIEVEVNEHLTVDYRGHVEEICNQASLFLDQYLRNINNLSEMKLTDLDTSKAILAQNLKARLLLDEAIHQLSRADEVVLGKASLSSLGFPDL